MRSVVLTLALLAPVSALAVEPLPVREMPLKLQAAFLHPMLFDVVCAGGVAGACGGGGGASASGTNVFTGSNTFKDNGFIIEDETDATKEITFSVGGLTTGNAPVFTFAGTAAATQLTLGTASLTLNSPLSVPAGTGTTRLAVGGTLCKGNPTGADATTEGTSEEIVGTPCLIAANSIAAGTFIQVQLTGVTAATANNKTIRVRMGPAGSCLTGVVLYTSGVVAWNNFFFATDFMNIYRQSATTVAAWSVLRAGAKGGGSPSAAPTWADDTETVDWAVDQEICVTFLTATAAAGATLNSYIVTVDQ